MYTTATARIATAFAMAMFAFETRLEGDGEEGQGLVEYGLILALVSILCVGALVAVKGGVNTTLTKVSDALK